MKLVVPFVTFGLIVKFSFRVGAATWVAKVLVTAVLFFTLIVISGSCVAKGRENSPEVLNVAA